MHIVYWAHSYRNEDAAINRHFGMLIEQAERMLPNFDPPSKTVNESKLEQNLRSCDGMVAVLTWRVNGPSPYILYEIGLAIRSRKPLMVFVDDRISSDILPPRILQRRFSHSKYFRQVREHTHALRELKTYIGDPPPPRYQPNAGQRTCGISGLDSLTQDRSNTLCRFISERGYSLVDLERIDTENQLALNQFEHLSNLDVVLRCADSKNQQAIYWAGVISAAAIPSITFTTNPDYPISEKYPLEFQPRLMNTGCTKTLERQLKAEFDLFEQNFITAENADEIDRYVKMQIQAGLLAGHYEADTRRKFLEVIMGDKYDISGQAGAVGPHAHAHDMTFTQIWNQIENKLNLEELADELRRLRQAMEHEASEPAQKLAVGAVAAAEQSAMEINGPKVVEYLKTAGKWALSISEKIGVSIATYALKNALGI